MTHEAPGAAASGEADEAPASVLSRRTLLRGAAATAAIAPLAACSGDGSNGAEASTAPTSEPATTPATTASTTTTTTGAGGGSGGGGGNGSGAGQQGLSAVDESWNEPWVWRPADWPGEALALNVVENQNPGAVIGFGNPSHVLFSYGGMTPGPTIRIRGDETLSITLRNLLGPDVGTTYVGPYPDARELTGYYEGNPLDTPAQPGQRTVPQQLAAGLGNERFDFCLGEHTNGQHTIHATNLHTHGLHVRPGSNPDGTHSDNVILRLIPQEDLIRREQVPASGEVECRFLRDGDEINFLAADDQVGQAHFEFRLGDVQGRSDQPHPPGTHWYHPHSHGATADQVSSGMAGFLIVEGDVDDAIRAELVPADGDTGDPSLKSGPNDYRERLMLIQRVFNTPTDPDSPRQSLQKNQRTDADAVNGTQTPATIFMRPNAIERWRVLNGSVDGKGFRRIMLLRGRYGTNADGRLVTLDGDGNPGELVSRADVEAAKVDIHQLSFDGITLVGTDGAYFIKALRDQGDAEAPFPLAEFPARLGPDQDPAPVFSKLADDYARCYADGDSLRNCYVRPNEVYLGPANRTDLLVSIAEPGEYSVIALGVILHADTPIQGMQKNVQAPFETATDGTVSAANVKPPDGPGDVVVGWLTVTGDAAPSKDIQSLNDVLPDVPEYLRPIDDDEPGLRTPEGDGFRTRVVTYSGLGANGMPLIRGSLTDPGANETPTSRAFAEFVRDDLAKPVGERLEGLRYARRYDTGDNDDYVLLAPNIRTMAIDGRKFDPNDPGRPRMMLDSAEEWAVYNASDSLWADTNEAALGRSQYGTHYDAVPLTFGDGMDRFRDDPGFQIVGRAVDHPFHIHQNPFWVIRIDVPAADGSLHNILPEPRWMDVVPVPRHRGRVVFRSRFPDYVGTYVNHCHILLHEDNGMMQPVEVTPFDQRAADELPQEGDIARANFVTRDGLAEGGPSDSGAESVTRLYPRPTPAEAYVRNVSFVDANHTTGQEYPGFEVTAPASQRS